MKTTALMIVPALVVLAAGGVLAQTPSSVVTPTTTSESVRALSDAMSSSARDNFRKDKDEPAARTAGAKGKAEEATGSTAETGKKGETKR